MVNVVATEKGYFGGELRDAGTRFNVPDEIWNDKKRRPKWATASKDPFGGKGDHDGDGEPGGSLPGEKATAKGKHKGKAETVKAQTVKPFDDAPEPETAKGNGVKEALGTDPDWLPPGSSTPKPVTD